jgi:hypothetical protein
MVLAFEGDSTMTNFLRFSAFFALALATNISKILFKVDFALKKGFFIPSQE